MSRKDASNLAQSGNSQRQAQHAEQHAMRSSDELPLSLSNQSTLRLSYTASTWGDANRGSGSIFTSSERQSIRDISVVEAFRLRHFTQLKPHIPIVFPSLPEVDGQESLRNIIEDVLNLLDRDGDCSDDASVESSRLPPSPARRT